MDWSSLDYCEVLAAVWTLILTAPIHCRGSIIEQIMECFFLIVRLKNTCALLCYLNIFLLFWSSTTEKSSQDNLLNICFRVSLKIVSHMGLKQHEDSCNFTNNLSLSCYWSLWINSHTSYLKWPYLCHFFEQYVFIHVAFSFLHCVC